MKTAYKAVTVTGTGDLISLLVDTGMRGCAHYAKKQWTSRESGCGPLCAFDSLANLRAFLHSLFSQHSPRREIKVYSCRVVPSSEENLYRGYLSLSGKLNLIVKRITALPAGTVLCDQIMLQEPVECLWKGEENAV